MLFVHVDIAIFGSHSVRFRCKPASGTIVWSFTDEKTKRPRPPLNPHRNYPLGCPVDADNCVARLSFEQFSSMLRVGTNSEVTRKPQCLAGFMWMEFPFEDHA
ncbi:hypothetical protein Agabi119p4_9054 [Agaricus bisporus var. burnettii]|uniref:Uncharacterized protein n=1 Tax=Agaricus bisporus var. burnettii TaxID=192524 RepID=A0A8H7EXT7_AGABI|nr:hypothetical protein Agabi119p4_9054 [Agaricus bisporus var. burnettii]